MTPQIKFRGFRTDGKGWAYGYYVYRPDGKHLLYWQPFPEATQNTYHQIHPESLGMFTGLHDKNGKEIYEGDNLKDDDGGFIYNNVRLGEVALGFDEFNIKYRAICFHAQHNDLSGYVSLSQSEDNDTYVIGTGQCEIIGNQWEVDNGK